MSLNRKIIVLAAACAMPISAQALVISADFNSPSSFDGLVNATTSGVESSAAAANAEFASANVWNGLSGIDFDGTNVSLTALDLLDSNGNVTSVGFTTSETLSYSFATVADSLRGDYFFWNSRGRPDTASWSITGLTAGGEYAMYFYAGSTDNPARSTSVLVDEDGNGSTGNDTAQTLVDPSQDAYFASIFADANGTISGLNTGLGGGFGSLGAEGYWAGFQLASVSKVPLPAPALGLLGGLGLLCGLRRKKRSA